jgi:hypothetical protein
MNECMGKGKVCTEFWWENLRERDHSEDSGVDGRIHSFILSVSQLMPLMYLSLGLIVQPLSVHSAQIQQSCTFYIETKVFY